MELSTMPLKFRVWDSFSKKFLTKDRLKIFLQDYSYADGETISLSRSRDFEISQSTGLKDKNGVEIFTGDIIETDLEDEGNYRGVVCYLEGTGSLLVDYGTQCLGGRWTNLRVWLPRHSVTGNIWQNPELLEAIDNHD